MRTATYARESNTHNHRIILFEFVIVVVVVQVFVDFFSSFLFSLVYSFYTDSSVLLFCVRLRFFFIFICQFIYFDLNSRIRCAIFKPTNMAKMGSTHSMSFGIGLSPHSKSKSLFFSLFLFVRVLNTRNSYKRPCMSLMYVFDICFG